MERDSDYMRRALELAATARGRVSPRPPVGCVVVAGSSIVGEGATQPTPGPHAEVAALRAAGRAARGSTVYVSLEPCAHTGATGPCTHALVEAGVRRVVVAARDPYPLVDGRGIAELRRSGVEVRTGVLRAAGRAVIEGFATWVEHGRPMLTLKLASTIDGKVAAPDGTSRWITGEAARAQVHEMRALADAVLVGSGTVATDDPELTVRLPGATRHPARVLVDSSGRTPAGARIFDGRAPAVVLTSVRAPARRQDEWRSAGADVRVLPEAEDGVDVAAAMAVLGEIGMCDVLAESGPRLSASLVAAGVVDRAVVYVAPSLIGGDAPGLMADGVKTLQDAYRLRLERLSRVGGDVRLDYRFGGGGS